MTDYHNQLLKKGLDKNILQSYLTVLNRNASFKLLNQAARLILLI